MRRLGRAAWKACVSGSAGIEIGGTTEGALTIFFDVSLHIEHMRGVFHRRWALPDSADPEAIAASGFNGALALIPKQSESRLRRSQVGSVLQS